MPSRRRFLELAGVASAGFVLGRGSLEQAGPDAVRVEAGTKAVGRMPVDFTGLSYEIVQLYNPLFFSAGNTQLVGLFRGLAEHGVLRLGGNLSDLSRWQSEAGDFWTAKQSAAVEKGKQYWEWKLTDEAVRANKDGAITPAAIKSLRGFLDACGWRLIYGLNFGSGSVERAADEAACVAREMGDRLIAFQVGNEVDFYGGNAMFRGKPYEFAQYYAEFQKFVSAVRERVPGARFAGPDTANNLGWMQSFAKEQVGLSSREKAVLLSSHYYAMGPAKDPAMDADKLLGRSAGLETQVGKVQAATALAGIPFRMTEGNSCFGGGKAGVSDAFCSALWVADYMLRLATAGYAGVNLHGGGDGIYTPIETLDARTAKVRPMYAGMQLAQMFAGYEMLACEVSGSGAVTAYAGRSGGAVLVAMINKGPQAVRVGAVRGVPGKGTARLSILRGEGLASTASVPLIHEDVSDVTRLELAAHSAVVQSWRV